MEAMRRAYSLLNVKQIFEDDSFYTITGIASTPTVDRMGDIVEPLGAKFATPMPLLWQHQADKPVGNVTFAKANKDGIPFEAKIPKVLEPGTLKDRIDEAVQSVKYRLVAAVSIGFQAVRGKVESLKDGGLHFLEWNWLELSLVTIPAQSEATITSIKSLDQSQLRAVSGEMTQRPLAVSANNSPGASGLKSKGTGMKTFKEQIESLEATRAADAARIKELLDKSGEEGRTLEGEEESEYDTLDVAVKQIDKQLKRLRDQQSAVVEMAQPVVEQTQTSRAPTVFWNKSPLPPGIRFARYAQCVGASKGNMMQAELLARKHFRDMPELAEVFKIASYSNLGEELIRVKAAVAAGTTSDTTWAAPLVQQQEAAAEFAEFLRPLTLLGRIPGVRRVPFNIKFPRQTSGTNGTFVGEGLPKPLGKLDFELLTLTWAKAATIVVMTDELMRFSNPSAEMLVRDDLAAGIAQYLDKRFIDPVYAGVANVSPASITNGITPIPSLGTSVANIEDTAKLALEALSAGNFTGNYVWIMNPSVAISLSLKRAATIEMRAFPDITAQGGTFLGYPVITSNNVALSGSPTESFVVLVDPAQIMLADDGGVTIDTSTEASLVMDGAPTNPATSTVSMFQSNMVALRAERYINWRMRHTGAVQVITMNVQW